MRALEARYLVLYHLSWGYMQVFCPRCKFHGGLGALAPNTLTIKVKVKVKKKSQENMRDFCTRLSQHAR